MYRLVSALFLSATFSLGTVAPASASVRLLVDTPDILAGDLFISGFGSSAVSPVSFAHLPLDAYVQSITPPGVETTSWLELESWLDVDNVEFPNVRFSIMQSWSNLPDDSELFAGLDFVDEVYRADRDGSDGTSRLVTYSTDDGVFVLNSSPVDMLVYDIAIESRLPKGPFSGRFCLAPQGAIAGGVSKATCDALIEPAIAALSVGEPAVAPIPVPAALPLALSGLVLLAGLRACQRRSGV